MCVHLYIDMHTHKIIHMAYFTYLLSAAETWPMKRRTQRATPARSVRRAMDGATRAFVEEVCDYTKRVHIVALYTSAFLH